MDIGFYIADLLQNQNEVSLPGVGTFTKERVAGYYDQTSNSFFPPAYRVSFNNIEADYDSLTDYISNKKNLSRSSAEYLIKKISSAIFDLLQTSGIAEIKPLGIIHKKNEDLTFEASENFDPGSKFYGLKPVSDLKHNFVQEVLVSEEFEIEEHNNTGKIIAISSILVVLITAVLLYVYNPAVKNWAQGLFPAAAPNSPVKPADSTSNKPAVVVQDSSSSLPDSIKTDSSKSILPETKSPQPETETVEIIGGSFGRRSEAENYIKEMKAKGQEARILEAARGPLIKVSLGSFIDEQSSQKELARIRKEINKDAWPVRYKPKKTQ